MMNSCPNQFHPSTVSQLETNPDLRIRVYADGVYDLFHYGHIEQLKQAKTKYPNTYLIVGVVSDADCLRYKGHPAVMTQEERARGVSMCPFVDEVMQHPPFYPTIQFCDYHRIDMVAHDSLPYEINEEMSDIADCYGPFKKADRFLGTVRTPLISTTELVHRIVSRAEEFRRNNVVVES